MKIKKIVTGLALFLFAVCAHAIVLDKSVATVNGKPILESDFNKVSGAFIAQYTAAAPKVMEQPGAQLKLEKEVLDQMINDEVLYQAAVKEGVKAREEEINEAVLNAKNALIPEKDEKGKEVSEKERNKKFEEALKKEGLSMKQFRDRLAKQIISRKYIETVLTTKVTPVTDADAKALYDEVKLVMDAQTVRNKEVKDVLGRLTLTPEDLKNKKVAAALEKYDKKTAKITPETHKKEVEEIASRLIVLSSPKVRIGHIFIAVAPGASASEIKEKEAKAKEIKKKIDGGLDFGAAVKEFSEDKNSLQTGGDMILSKGQAPAPIDDKAFSLDVGKVSEPIRSEIGFHIIKVKEKSAGEEVTYEKIARELGQFIAAQRVQAAITQYIAELKAKSEIKINKDFGELDKLTAEQAAMDKKEGKKPEAKQEPKK